MEEKVTTTRARETKPRIVKTDDLLEQIFERVAKGESLNKICSEPNMPTRKSFYEWVAQDETVLLRYEFAMIMRADTYAEETIEIADESSNDWTTDKNGYSIVDHEAINRSRLRVDARKWYASKLAPKKYGDKVTNEIQGNPEQPVAHSINIRFIKSDTSAA